MLNDTANTPPSSISSAESARVSRLSQVLEQLNIDPAKADVDPDQAFTFRAPDSLLGLVKSGDVNDPILRQILPVRAERDDVAGYSDDPVGEARLSTEGALLQKYSGRALLIATEACDIHCRYCFRRTFDYSAARSTRRFDQEFKQLAADPSIHELILSGGDPLTLSNERIGAILDQAEAIPHLSRLRIHTRSAVVRPARLDSTLLERLSASRLNVVMVVHANCVNELSEAAKERLLAARESGVSLLNQSVLLAGVNNSVDALEALSLRLFDCGVLPYYLHLLDSVSGAAHFSVPIEEAVDLMQRLRARLPGYLMPALVREDAGATSKTPIGDPKPNGTTQSIHANRERH